MLQLDHDLDQLSLTEKSDDSSSSNSPTEPHSAPVTPAHRQERPPITVGYRRATQGGFLEGLLGCLRPVWTIIGKATTAELKQQGETLTTVVLLYWYLWPSNIWYIMGKENLNLYESYGYGSL